MLTRVLIIAAIGLSATGCQFGRQNIQVLENPLLVPGHDREFVWNQIVDTLDDYFRIAREERVRQIGNVLTEGRIETFPVVGATYFEPWRRDSTPGFERKYATLQSVRRRATVRVWPATGGYFVEVIVVRELEDLERPEFAPIGGEVFRHDGTLVRDEGQTREQPISLGWIPLGRDTSLEQRILTDIHSRLYVTMESLPK